MNKSMMRKSAFAVSLVLSASTLLSIPSTWAADCGKTANSKLAPCVSATAQPGPGSSMQTIQQGGAQAQKKAAQSIVETKTAVAQGYGREKRTWVGQTALTCKKGNVTLHMAAGTAQCPDGFRKS